MIAPDALPAPARKAAEDAYRRWRIGDDGEGRLHAALIAYAAATQAEATRSLSARMAAMEETIRAAERERVARLADESGALYPDLDADGLTLPFANLIRELP